VLRHPDFKKTEATRPDLNPAKPIKVVKSPDPNWRYGQCINDNGASLEKKHVEIDPYAKGRPMMSNYKLLISGIVPQPIGFLSTKSADGSTENLAPMSYFQVVDHNPPMFVVGFSAEQNVRRTHIAISRRRASALLMLSRRT
jgi:hypothetical protein